jgi:hypothetical protein
MSALATILLEVACSLVVTALLYDLFKPVNRAVSALAAFFSLIGCAAQATGGVLQLAALMVAGGARHLNILGLPQLQVPALMFPGLRAQILYISLVLFGIYCVIIGSLILRSTILPRIVGMLMAIAGLAYVANSRYLPGLGGGLVMLWLIVIVVNARRWKKPAGPAMKWRSTVFAAPPLNRK